MKRFNARQAYLSFIFILSVFFITGCGGGGETGHWLSGNPDTTPPMVTNVAPLPNATGVAINTKITATFTEAMDPLTITTTTFTVTGPGATSVSGAVTYTGVTAVFRPDINLLLNTRYTAAITTGARDLAGNPLASNFVWSFTTGSVADTTPPTVTLTVPANAATGVALNTKISATFSEAMDPFTITTTTFTLRQGTSAWSGTVAYSGVTAVFTPPTNLAAGSTYTATITTGAQDLAGNALASNYVWSFTTGTSGAPDTTAPTITATINANGATGVAINTKVGATFSEAMDPLTITVVNFTLKETVTGTAIAGVLSYSGVNAVFIPLSNLAPNTRYTVTVKGGVTDMAGNAMGSDYVWSWTTSVAQDTTAPWVTDTVNHNGATNVPINTKVGATFSEAMDPLTITNLIFTLESPVGTPVLGTLSYSGLNAVFIPLSNLAPNTLYTVKVKGGVSGAKDLAGIPMATDYVWSWTTGAALDTARPTVISTFPADLATNVALNSQVTATFSKAMDPLTIKTTTFTLTAPGLVWSATVAYSGVTAILSPFLNLAANTTYTATVTTGATDLAGNQLAGNQAPLPAASDYVWRFTTGTGVAPVIPAVVPLGSASGFGIAAWSSISNTGATMINGDVSLNPGTSHTGLTPAMVNGTIHVNDAVSAQVYTDLLSAYNFAKALASSATVPDGQDLGAWAPPGSTLPAGTLPPGVYTNGSAMSVNTPLTLDAGGNVNAFWVFQIGSSLTTFVGAPGGNVLLANGALAKNVFWVPTAAATIGVGTTFNGSVLAGGTVTGQNSATINGRLLGGALGAGSITLDTNTVNVP